MMKVLISKEEYDEYQKLKEKDTPMKKVRFRVSGRTSKKHCPKCNYVVDDGVPKQKYCDRCGQRLEENFEIIKRIRS